MVQLSGASIQENIIGIRNLWCEWSGTRYSRRLNDAACFAKLDLYSNICKFSETPSIVVSTGKGGT